MARLWTATCGLAPAAGRDVLRAPQSLALRAEEALQPIGPGLLVGRVLRSALLQRVVQLLQQLALVLGELHRRLHRDVAIEVAGVGRTHALDALAAQAELLARLRAFGDVDRRLAIERRHVDLSAQRRARDAHRDHAVQVVAVPLEDRVLLQPDLDEQVARRPAVRARLAVARAADAHAVVDAGGAAPFH